MAQSTTRVLELFAGIGGLSAAIGSHQVAAAIDINTDAARVYQANFSAAYHCREIDSVSDDEFREWQADAWWFSAPCQPYTRRGHQRGIRDRRSFALDRVLRGLRVHAPPMIGLENVPAFARDEACRQLVDWLQQSGYYWQTRELCPSQLGWPNRRLRFFLIASQKPLPDWMPLPNLNQSLESLIEAIIPSQSPHLWLSPTEADRYWSALDRVDPRSQPITACFAASYGKTRLHAGSYLVTSEGVRRFSPMEVARLLGFPASFQLPRLSEDARQSDRKHWKLLGNSLSIPCARYVMKHLGLVHPSTATVSQ